MVLAGQREWHGGDLSCFFLLSKESQSRLEFLSSRVFFSSRALPSRLAQHFGGPRQAPNFSSEP